VGKIDRGKRKGGDEAGQRDPRGGETERVDGPRELKLRVFRWTLAEMIRAQFEKVVFPII
jgi:hypothetical protein